MYCMDDCLAKIVHCKGDNIRDLEEVKEDGGRISDDGAHHIEEDRIDIWFRFASIEYMWSDNLACITFALDNVSI